MPSPSEEVAGFIFMWCDRRDLRTRDPCLEADAYPAELRPQATTATAKKEYASVKSAARLHDVRRAVSCAEQSGFSKCVVAFSLFARDKGRRHWRLDGLVRY